MSDEITSLFKEAGALLEGHFLLTSGLHSPMYWEKFKILQYPRYTEKLCGLITRHYAGKGVEVVVGPTTGGVILAYEVARQMGLRGFFAEKEGSERVFRRGFTIKPKERVLIVDDILTTGGSIMEVVRAVQKLGGDIVGIGILVDRTEKGLAVDIPLFSCLKAVTPAYDPAECPLCKKGIPLTRPGGQ